MVKELSRGWTPEKAEHLANLDRDLSKARQSGRLKSKDLMSHYFYFNRKEDAEAVGNKLRDRGFLIEIRPGDYNKSWLALAKGALPVTRNEMEELRDDMERLAALYRGEYDGWEASVDILQKAEPPKTVN